MKRRILSIILCICMMLTLLPTTVWAAVPIVTIGMTTLTNGKYYTISNDAVTELDSAPDVGYLHYTLDGTNAVLSVTGDVSYNGTIPALSIKDSILTLTGSGNLTMSTSTVPAVSGSSGSLTTSSYTGNLSFSSTASNAITNCTDVTLETTGILTLSGDSSDATIYSRNNVTLKGRTVSLTNGSGYQLVNASGENVSVSATDGDLSLTGSTDFSPLIIADSGEQGANGKVTLSSSGDISVTNTGEGGNAIVGALRVSNAKNVSVTNNSGTPTIAGAADIAVDGDVSITNNGTGMTVSRAFIVRNAQNVTVSSSGEIPTCGGVTDITADGNISIKNTGTGMAVGNSLTATSKKGSVTVHGKHPTSYVVLGTATITAAEDINITSASAIEIGGKTSLTAGGVIVCATSVGTTITKDGTPINASYGGDVSTSGLNLNTGTPSTATLYKAGSGYALFTPLDGGTPATLKLHNATINNTTAFINSIGPEHEGIALPAGNITIQVEGTNNIKSGASYGIGSGTNITISGDGVLTVDGNFANGIWLKSGSLTFASGANVTLNSVVVIPDEKNMWVTTVYGNITAKLAVITGDYQLQGAVTISAGAVMTVPVGEVLYLDNTESITISGQIVNNGTIALPWNYTVEMIKALNLTGSVWLYDRDTLNYKVYINGSIYASGGDVSSRGLNLYSNTPVESTYYKAGDGYILFTPAKGDNSAELLLHNASMDVTGSEGMKLILLPKGSVNMRVSGKNKLSASAMFTDGISSDKNNPTNLIITSSDHGTLEISVTGTKSSGALGGGDCELASLIIGGNVSVTAIASGQSSVGTTLEGNLTIESGANFRTRGDMLDLAAYGESSVMQNFSGVVAFLNTDTLSYKLDVYGACDLPGFLSNFPVGSINSEGKIFNVYLNVTSGSTLTIPAGKTLTVNDMSKLTNNGTIVNNGMMILPSTADTAVIRTLKLIGAGVVKAGTQNYTNDGVAVTEISGGLNLTIGDHSSATLANDGYTFNNNTLTLVNTYIAGSLTLPRGATVNTTAKSIIYGTVSGDGDSAMNITFAGTAPLIINGGINGGINNDTITVQNAAQVTVNGSVFLGASGGWDGILNVIGSGTSLRVTSSSGYAVMCDRMNLQNGASLIANTEGSGSIGVEALSGVNITGGSTLTAGCDYGVYIIDGMLTVDDTSKLITNGAVAPFCIVDSTSLKSQSNIISLAGTPDGTEIKSVTGTRGKYWSLVTTGGSLSVADENSTPVTLSGAKSGLLTFAKSNSGGNSGGGTSASDSYMLIFETNGGSKISSVSKDSGTAVDLSAYKPTRDGYSFAGWYADIALTMKITSVTLTKNTTVYAKWMKKTTNPFTDVSESDDYYDAVLWAIENSVTNGTPDKAFNPDMICSRAQAVTFLWRAAGSPEPTSAICPFTDVLKGDYFYKAVLWAIEKGITKGTSSTTFSPNITVTRSQNMTFLWRAAGKAASASSNPFVDVVKDAYYYNAVLWAVEKSITKGTSATEFSPDDGCTRAQTVTFLFRYMGNRKIRN